MAEKSTFFNSVWGDRKYKVEDIAAHFSKVLTNGVFPSGTQLQVTEDEGMNANVSAGSAWINGYAYHNDDDFNLEFDVADGVLHRIDRVVVRWSRLNRSINLAVVKGTPASTPTAPVVTRTADNWELGIATVAINAGTTTITQAMITDTRLDSSVCGLVSSLIQPDTSEWFTQFNAAFTSTIEANQSSWDLWFATVQNILDEEVAGNLLNMINDLAGSGRSTETVKSNADALASHMAEYTKFVSDYEYQPVTIIGTQIRVTKQSDTAILKFRLATDVTGGAITISKDAGATSKPLVDIDGQPVTELSKGFVEVIENAENFTYAPKGGKIKIDTILADYEISAGEIINAGDLVEFINNKAKKPAAGVLTLNTTVTYWNKSLYVSAILLEPNKVLVVYTGTDNEYGYATLLTVSGTTVTVGTTKQITTIKATHMKAILIDTNKVLAVYTQTDSYLNGCAVVLTVSGTDITIGSILVFDTGKAEHFSIDKIEKNKVLVGYRQYNNTDGTTARAIVLSVSGTTVSAGSSIILDTASAISDFSVSMVDTNKAFLLYEHDTNDQSKAVVLAISGMTITAGSTVVISTSSNGYHATLCVEPNKVLVTYTGYSNSYGYVRAVTISGMTITVHNAITYYSTSSGAYMPFMVLLNPTTVLIVFQMGGSYYAAAKLLTISGTTLSIRGADAPINEIANSISAVLLEPNKALVVYTSWSTSYGKASVATINRPSIQGLATQNGAGGETKKFFDWRFE